MLCEFEGTVCFQDNSENLNISPLNSKMNAMSTFQQLVASVDHEGLYRPWVLLLSMHLMLCPGSIRVSILHNHVSTFKSDYRQEAPLPSKEI